MTDKKPDRILSEVEEIAEVLAMHRTLEIDHILKADEIYHIESVIRQELRNAEKDFPFFPINPNDMIAIIGEEFGEATQSSVDYTWNRRPTLGYTRKELSQTAAMCIRSIAMMIRISRVGIPEEFNRPKQIRIEREGDSE